MRISASVQSKAYKRGAAKALAKILKVEPSLDNFAGKLELNAESRADYALLTAMYKHVFSYIGNPQGSIEVKNKEGVTVLTYYYAPEVKPEATDNVLQG